MKETILALVLLLHFGLAAFSQSSKIKAQLRIPIQYEQQKAAITTPFGIKEENANAVNFGIDALLNYNFDKVTFHAGAGFFRNRFNIKREYDHRALNVGRDSLPIATDADNYTYSLLRFLTGISYEVAKIKKVNVSIGLEHFFNFCFQRKYNGRIPFEGANTKYNGFTYFGNSAQLFFNFRKNRTALEPYVRIYNKYKKDRFLKEKENESIIRYFDAYGISIKYFFTF